MAGRIAYHVLDGFGLDGVRQEEAEKLWLPGGFPRSFLAPNASDSFEWRRGFVRIFLERDLPALGMQVPGLTLRRFWRPSNARSMHAARETLRLDRIDVIHAGSHTFRLADRIRAVAFARLLQDVEPL